MGKKESAKRTIRKKESAKRPMGKKESTKRTMGKKKAPNAQWGKRKCKTHHEKKELHTLHSKLQCPLKFQFKLSSPESPSLTLFVLS
jgi:hypothetical protein